MCGERLADRSAATRAGDKGAHGRAHTSFISPVMVGLYRLDLGAVTPFFYAFREREAVLEIMEETCGARLTQNYSVPGGVMYDIHPNFQNRVKDVIKQIKSKFQEYDDILSGNVIFEQRTKGVGYSRQKMLFLLAAQAQRQGAPALAAI